LTHALQTVADIVAFAAMASWIYLAFFRGYFWRIAEELKAHHSDDSYCPDILVLIPARDEASCIEKSVTSLLKQNYCGSVRVVVIDDGSSDGTAEIARRVATELRAGERLKIVSATPPPIGWTGKLWALAEGLRQARTGAADYLLLTDADIVHAPENLKELVARAQSGNFDLVSLMVKLRCESFAERAFVPAFTFFFFMLYPPGWVADRRRRTAAAAGGCMLIRSQTLADMGGIASIHGELIDDCALARGVKKIGGRVFLDATSRTHSLRAYSRIGDVEQMIARTAFTQLQHSTVLLLGTLIAMSIVFVSPPILMLAPGAAFWMGAVAWLFMSLCYLPALRLYKLSAVRAATLPAIAVFYLAATLHSAVLSWRGRGGLWKGRVQDSASA
jgi:hopene-associated glycosyltransferase HpnB